VKIIIHIALIAAVQPVVVIKVKSKLLMLNIVFKQISYLYLSDICN